MFPLGSDVVRVDVLRENRGQCGTRGLTSGGKSVIVRAVREAVRREIPAWRI